MTRGHSMKYCRIFSRVSSQVGQVVRLHLLVLAFLLQSLQIPMALRHAFGERVAILEMWFLNLIQLFSSHVIITSINLYHFL